MENWAHFDKIKASYVSQRIAKTDDMSLEQEEQSCTWNALLKHECSIHKTHVIKYMLNVSMSLRD